MQMKKTRFVRFVSVFLSVLTVVCLTSVCALNVAAEPEMTDVSDKYSREIPAFFEDSDYLFEVEDCFRQEGSGFNAGQDGDAVYYYLKGTYDTSYMKFVFNVEQEGTYELCIGLQAFPSSTPRTAEVTVNGGERFYFSRDNTDVQARTPEWMYGMTVYCKAGENNLTVYLGYDFDNSTVKSLFFDNFSLVRTGKLPNGYVFPGEEPVEAPIDVTGCTKDVIRLSANTKPLINSVNYCVFDFAADEAVGDIMTITVDKNDYPGCPDIAMSYTKYLRALGIDENEPICDQYEALVIPVKGSADHITDATFCVNCLTNGNNVSGAGTEVREAYEADGTWQYIVFDMLTASEWYEVLSGLYLRPALGAEEGAVIQIGELRLFETYEAATDYANEKMGIAPETEAPTEAVTDAPGTETEAATDAPAATEAATDAATDAAAESGTAAAAEPTSDTGCASVVGAVSVCMTLALCAAAVIRKKEN